MKENFNTPKEITENYLTSSIKKIQDKNINVILLGIFAGMYIAFGACCSMVAIHNIADAGIAKLVAGVIFPVGLMLILLTGGNLFTGDCMMIMGVLDKKYSAWAMIKKLIIILCSNAIGALIVVFLIKFAAQQDLSAGALGGYTIKVAYLKTALPFGTAIASGVLCNIVVCAAVIMAASSKDTIGKIFGAFFPIMVFVIGGFEHCVANLYYIPAGILARTNENYVNQAIETYKLTAEQVNSLTIPNFLLHNLLPVTIGNIIGGMVFIAIPLYIVHIRKKSK